MIRRLERYSPPGYDVRTEFGYIANLVVFSLLFSFLFFWRFQKAYELLFGYEDGIKVLLPNAQMPTFESLSRFSSSFLRMLPLWVSNFIRYRYNYFNVETKSVYVMLRLPQRSEYHKRCWAIPFAFIILSYLLIFLLNVLYFIYYKNMVPLSAWPPGQSMNLWSVIL